MIKSIQLNADIGEGHHTEAMLMPNLSYCNIACGGHYGDVRSMQEAIRLAVVHKVHIGAHPSYPDEENFGRISMDLSLEEFEKTIQKQLTEFRNLCNNLDAQVYHVKAHGALYHDLVTNSLLRAKYLDVVYKVLGKVKVFLPVHVKAKELELDLDESMVIYEAFGDRRYDDKLNLLSRHEPNSVLNNLQEIEEQIYRLICKAQIVSDTGTTHSVRFDTICLHGDHPELKRYFPYLIQNLKAKGVMLCD